MTGRSHRLRRLPNLISAGRLVAGPVLLCLAIARVEGAFRWLLIAALASDVADGWIARRLGLQSRLGAMLDSAADVVTLLSAAVGVAVFHPVVFQEHAIACATVLGGWVLVGLLAFVRYRRLSSFHTYASKLAGYALGFFLVALFLWRFFATLFHAAVALSICASAEELALLWYLPKWRPDVRGLWWVWRESRSANDQRSVNGSPTQPD